MKTNRKVSTIKVLNMPCYCSIGIDPEEKKMGQRLFIDVNLDVYSFKLSSSDNISDTVSYVDIYKTVQKTAKTKPHSLIEVLADEIAEALLQNPLIVRVKVVVHKPHIPYLDFQGNVSVEVERTK